MTERRAPRGPAFWLLMAASGAAVAFLWAVTRPEAARQWLRERTGRSGENDPGTWDDAPGTGRG